MSTSIQSSNGICVRTENGKVSIEGKVTSLKVNGTSIDESQGLPEQHRFSKGFITGILVSVFIYLLLLSVH